MPLLVDGDNLLGTWPGRRRSDGERRRLAFELSRWGRQRGKAVVVVFDGEPPPGLRPAADVRYAGAGRTADDVIVELLRSRRDRRGWIVVTSDRALGDRCRHLDASVRRCDRFRGELAPRGGPEKPEVEHDIEHWLEVFGDEPGPAAD